MIIRLLLTNFVIPIIGMIYLYILMAKDYNLYYTSKKLTRYSKTQNNIKKNKVE